jgi:hypothetical protein
MSFVPLKISAFLAPPGILLDAAGVTSPATVSSRPPPSPSTAAGAAPAIAIGRH